MGVHCLSRVLFLLFASTMVVLFALAVRSQLPGHGQSMSHDDRQSQLFLLYLLGVALLSLFLFLLFIFWRAASC